MACYILWIGEMAEAIFFIEKQQTKTGDNTQNK